MPGAAGLARARRNAMIQPGRRSLEKALDFMLGAAALEDTEALVRHVVTGLPSLVASEITTLSLCDLSSGTRRVLSFPDNSLTAADLSRFNQVFRQHPLVRYHSTHPHGGSWRISDSLTLPAFRDGAVYCEYYRHIGIDHVVAVPIISNSRMVMSFVLNRRGSDFADGECALLDRIRPSLANLYRFTVTRTGPAQGSATPGIPLTPREEEVLSWVAAGKSDRQVAAIVGTSVRTVQKHLANAYVKLGVENRTAAAMRLEALRRSITAFTVG
jgi:DNA-binding CsgD family transcriptional regulator